MTDVFLDLALNNLRTAAARLEEAALDVDLAVRDHDWGDRDGVATAARKLAAKIDKMADRIEASERVAIDIDEGARPTAPRPT